MDAYHSQTGGRSRMPSIFETLYPGISSSQAQGINSTCQVPEAYKAEVLGPAGACFGGHEALDMANNDLIPDSLLVYGEQQEIGGAQAWRISTQQDAQPSYPPMLEQNGCLDGWRPVRECIAPVPLSPVSDAKCLLSIRDETVYPASPGYHQGTGQDHQSIFTSENNFTATINVAFNSHTPQYLGHGQFPQMSPEYQGFLSEEHGCGQPDLYLAEPQYPELPRLELVVETRQLEMYHSRQDPFQAQSIQDEFLDDMIAGDIDKFLKECTRPADDVHVFHVEAGNPMHAEPASRAGSAHQADGGQQRGRRPRFQNLSSTNPKSQPKNRAKGNNSSKSGGARRVGSSRRCIQCNAHKTPQWRTGPAGPATLCNACGVRFHKGQPFKDPPARRRDKGPSKELSDHSATTARPKKPPNGEMGPMESAPCAMHVASSFEKGPLNDVSTTKCIFSTVTPQSLPLHQLREAGDLVEVGRKETTPPSNQQPTALPCCPSDPLTLNKPSVLQVEPTICVPAQ
eukprot:jgi/Botrbrau1/10048/Bobra.0355s0007.4